MRAKFFFAMYLLRRYIKSFFCKFKFRLFGAHIGKNVIMENTDICGYVNKVRIGDKCTLERGVNFIINKEGNLTIEENTLLAYRVIIVAGIGNVKIGKDCMIAANSYIINNDHSIYGELKVRNPSHLVKDICIEDNVWIGANCSILKGVTIGEGSVIGAGSIVTKNIPPYAIAFGNPCKVIKFRYSEEVLETKLLEENYDLRKIKYILSEIKNVKNY